MTLERFEQHIAAPSPAFRCYDCGDREERPRLLARVRNRIRKPLQSHDLLSQLPAEIRAFYSLHDGVKLYQDLLSETAGMAFLPRCRWEKAALRVRKWNEAMELDPADMPDWLRDGPVFGTVPQSGNYFLYYEQEPGIVPIYYWDHDDFNEEPIATSLDEFLGMIVDDPPGVLERFGCYARYSDGQTTTQWIPKEYVPNADASR